MSNLKATVKMPGTCGELVQGAIDNIPFHITCPIDIYSVVHVELSKYTSELDYPPECPKAATAVKRALSFMGQLDVGGKLTVHSPIPVGKGMASSTADVAAAIEAVSIAFRNACTPHNDYARRRIEKRDVAELALSIEPTDGSLFPDIVLFDHIAGKAYRHLGSPPPIDIIILDFGGEVDTIAFNRHNHQAILRQLEPQITRALELVQDGIINGEPQLVGQGATISARINQEILFKPQLEHVISLAKEVGAVGVNVAHSGTVIGILLDARKGDREAAAEFLKKRLAGLDNMFLCSLISGGCQEIP